MNNWRKPITDRMATDVAGADAGSLAYQKGTLNADDLNRIEGNYRYLLEHLETDAIFIPHAYRNREETTIEIVDVPTEYTPVEYIESSGTQYIDTGFKPNQNTKLEVTFQTSVKATIAACDTYWKDNGYGVWSGAGEYGNEVITTLNMNKGTKSKIVVNKGVFTNDEVIVWEASAATFQTVYPLTIFALNRGGSITEYNNSLKIFSCKIYDDETLIRDFIPVKDASGVACLYDKVSQTYFYNAGTGTFTSGTELPKETTKEIIEVKRKYTDWQEHNLPWLSEINRIRVNYNALVRLFLVGLGLPVLTESNYLDWQEVNDWERIADVGKTIFENMEREYRYCGVEESGGDRLL